MPVIVVFGVPEFHTPAFLPGTEDVVANLDKFKADLDVFKGNLDKFKTNLREFKKSLRKTAAEVKELNLTEADVTVKLLPDLSDPDPDEKIEIILFVCGLFEKAERTNEARKDLADKLTAVTLERFQDAKVMVECFVNPFNPSQGFATKSN